MDHYNDFSVLQSVYYKDNYEHLHLSLKSIFDQTKKPNEIIIVKDGELSCDLENVLEYWKDKLPLIIKGYMNNMGLSYALNLGLSYCTNEIIARMDSDDICYHDRFEKQLFFMNNNPDVVLVSGFIDEFIDKEENIVFSRKVPLEHIAIVKYLQNRNAFNHMAVMFKKSAIQTVGGYRNVSFFEDYDLWIRIVLNNFKVANIPEKLVKARIGNDMIGRRHGLKYAQYEIHFLLLQYKKNFISLSRFLLLIFTRVPLRLVPKKILELVYKYLRGIK